MKALLIVLIGLLSLHSYADPIENKPINWPGLLNYSAKFHDDSELRANYSLHMPLPFFQFGKFNSEFYGYFTYMHLQGNTFHNTDDDAIKSNSIGNITLLNEFSRSLLVTSFVIHRSLNFDNKTTDKTLIESTEWFLPKLQYSYRASDKFTTHVEADLHSFERPTNHKSRLGLSYRYSPSLKFSTTNETIEWNLDSGPQSTSGKSSEISLKSIYTNTHGWNFALSIGRESIKNTKKLGNQVQDRLSEQGWTTQIEISSGQLYW